jgi:cytochrome c biogenesis protein CcdA/glutaredoxin
MNNKFFTLFVIGIFFFLSSFFVLEVRAQEDTIQQNDVHLHLFYGQGCPHCGNLILFLDSLKEKYSTLKIYEHEVYQNNVERELFQKMAEDFNTPIEGVPTVFIDNKVIVGFSNTIGISIENEIKRCLEVDCGNPVLRCTTPDVIKSNDNNISPSKDPEDTKIVEKLTIPIVVIAAAIDAINPCAFAVLIILMTAALSIVDKKKALKFGFAFSASIYISYFLMGLGLFSALQASGISHTFYIIVTILAVIVGLLNVKDYFWYGKGFLMEVPLSWRPTMKKIINSTTTPFGAFIAGFAVSLFELPCTGGPYIVILGLLAEEVTKSVGILYLLLYNLVFISPLILLSLVIYKGFSTTSQLETMRQEKIKVLHLIAGILMIIIATVMIISLANGWV